MSKKEKEYAKKAFDDVAHKYHDIAFFKILTASNPLTTQVIKGC